MPPRFWAKGKGKAKAGGSGGAGQSASKSGGGGGGGKGQQAITRFFPTSPTAPGPAAAATSQDEGRSSPPPAKRQRTGGADGAALSADSSQEHQQQQQSPASAVEASIRRPTAAAAAAAGPPSKEAFRLRLLGTGPDAGGATGAGSGGGGSSSAGAAAAPPVEPAAVSGGQSSPAQKLTPLEQQVVALKRRHPGVVLCVEVGYKAKFFGEDAVVASRELGLFTWQDRAFLTCWVPTERLEVHVRRLVLAGHKVGVVRQVETAAIKAAGDSKSGPFDRRLTALHTRATLEAGELGGLESEEEEEGGGGNGGGGVRAARRRSRRRALDVGGGSQWLVACVEEAAHGGGAHAVELGLVAVEPSTGAVMHAQFRDGLMRQALESKLLFAAPAELLLAEPASAETRRLLQHLGDRLGVEPRLEGAAAATHATADAALAAVEAFYEGRSTGGGGPGASTSAAAQGSPAPAAAPAPPAALAAVRALPPLVLRALAHLLDHLRPFGLEGVLRLAPTFQEWAAAQEMRLSANTLRQLEIFQNSTDGGPAGSLFRVVDHTQTAMGRRLLRSWVGKPLRSRDAILARLDAVQELAEQGGGHPALSRLRPALKALPDLERGITRAFHGNARPSDFAALLQQFAGLQAALGLGTGLAEQQAAAEGGAHAGAEASAEAGSSTAEAAEASGAAPSQQRRLAGLQDVASPLLAQLLRAAGDPAVAAAAQRMLDCLDLSAVAANDKLGVLRDSDRFPGVRRWRGELAAAEAGLAGLLPAFRRTLQLGSALQYVSLHKVGEYLVEVPLEAAKRAPKEWQKARTHTWVNATKKVVRYRPPEVAAALQRLELAKEHLAAACAKAWQQFLSDFASEYVAFRAAAQALAALDCLCGLAVLASSAGYTRPELAGDEEAPQLHIEGGRHPVVELLLEGRGGQAYVPNDTHLQGDAQRCMVITGPNMGGKSCYTRQTALIAIMAQLGSFVPAAACRLCPLDGVFTRMGAADNLALGRSTFAEELGEASAILSAATPASLVVLDELGRGTSTADGSAIAEAALAHLAGRLRPLTLFITHYPEVCLRLQAALPGTVGCYRMAHLEEEGRPPAEPQAQAQPGGGSTAADADTSAADAAAAGDGSSAALEAEAGQALEARERQLAAAALDRIVFLFKVVPGVAPASYGLNVARMAQLPDRVIQQAAERAAAAQAAFEKSHGTAATAVAGASEAAALAEQVRAFLRLSLQPGGAGVDAEAGRALQQRVRQLLGAAA